MSLLMRIVRRLQDTSMLHPDATNPLSALGRAAIIVKHRPHNPRIGS